MATKKLFKLGRKFIAATFCGALAITSLVLFYKAMERPNSSLFITLVCAPCIGVIITAVGGQAVHDSIHGEGYEATTDSKKE